VPSQYKEAANMGEWKEGKPLDHLSKGNWWEIFNDPDLDQLEKRALAHNQELKASFAVMNQARAAARIARSDFLPSLDAGFRFRRERFSPNAEPDFGALTANTFHTPLDLSYEIDLWGKVRRGFEAAREDAKGSAAALHNLLLTLQSDLAQNYFTLRALDVEITALKSTVGLRRDQVGIVRSRLEAGLGAELDVARAETEVAATESELASLQRRRAELENAIAILVGANASSFKLAPYTNPGAQWKVTVPQIPAGLPSDLLERRPDVAEAERQLAADNARIGVAKASFFPVLRLTGSGGFLSAEAEHVFNWESRVWNIGPSLSLPIFAGGRNRANYRRAQARYEEAVARYRQRILVAFADVENSLASLRYLGEQSQAQQRAVESASRARQLAMESFSAGLVDYMNVIDADRAALFNERLNVQLAGQRLVATVQLVKALGGGWHVAQIQPAGKENVTESR
jgi:multidrug efflux system outer membrane protein